MRENDFLNWRPCPPAFLLQIFSSSYSFPGLCLYQIQSFYGFPISSES